MTHDELLEEINEEIKDIAFNKFVNPLRYLQALRAVVELHKPLPAQFKEGKESCVECMSMDYDLYWEDCPTIKAIIKEFN